MIVIDLRCSHGHRFEGWFASAESFTSQNQAGQVACPYCGQSGIDRVPSATKLVSADNRTREEAAKPALPEDLAKVEQDLVHVLRSLAAQCENVGERFADEARRMHYEEIERRNIRGFASKADTIELLEEGIVVLPVPGDTDEERH